MDNTNSSYTIHILI